MPPDLKIFKIDSIFYSFPYRLIRILNKKRITLDDATIRAIATSTIITPGCCKQLTPDEIVEILNECK